MLTIPSPNLRGVALDDTCDSDRAVVPLANSVDGRSLADRSPFRYAISIDAAAKTAEEDRPRRAPLSNVKVQQLEHKLEGLVEQQERFVVEVVGRDARRAMR
jgi:hypothetical protein